MMRTRSRQPHLYFADSYAVVTWALFWREPSTLPSHATIIKPRIYQERTIDSSRWPLSARPQVQKIYLTMRNEAKVTVDKKSSLGANTKAMAWLVSGSAFFKETTLP
jgi:hypothetical protein